MASTFSRGRPSPPRVSLLHMWSAILLGGVRCRGRLYRPGSGGSGDRAAGVGSLFCGGKAVAALPGVRRYAEGALVYGNQVEARGAPWADAGRDRPRGRDDQAVDAPLDVVDGLQVVVAAEDELGTELGEGVEGGLGGCGPAAPRERAPYGGVV